MSRQRWTREPDLAVLYLKVEYHGQLNQGHPTVHALADAMGRPVASIWMWKGNFDSLDPSVLGVGLRKRCQTHCGHLEGEDVVFQLVAALMIWLAARVQASLLRG